ncbi:phytanoyl-CoA dioxygenase family protein [Pelagibius marinus]|uniref:phytanoyl-CoA dioxygenase family protein n=1 Tax=Pelagibius marinus TaxID=2762760 RepID=UPI001872E414|nr:phytanoyl-CoA dioxygenase family protein [Pelagibius marinus]
MGREVLSEEQVRFYEDNGYLLLEERVPAEELERLHGEIARFVREARGMTASDERLDLEDSHTPENPRVRRIKLPHKLSPAFAELMRSDWILAPVRDLIGPDLRLHTSKLNMKSAGYGAAVEWHQDWAFYPHTNDDILAVGVILDDMAEENGPLMVFPGSHKGPVYDHHAGGYFAGAVSLAANGLHAGDAATLTGPAGSISLHHVRALHGSAPNRSARDRRMLFYEITSADAFPIQGSMSAFEGLEEYDSRLLCGEGTIRPRLTAVPVRLPQPQPPTVGSIYEIQKAMTARNF